jgi:hypothetical protein
MNDWNDMTSGMGEPLGLTDKSLIEMSEEMMAVRERYRSMAELLRLLVEEEGVVLSPPWRVLLDYAADAMEMRAEKAGRTLYHWGNYIEEPVRQERTCNLIKLGLDP